MRDSLRKDLEISISEYVESFEKQLEVEADCGNFPLGVYCFADMFVSFEELVFIVDNGMSFKQVNDWYWEHWYGAEEDVQKLNLITYHKLYCINNE